MPYLAFDEVDFDVIVGSYGDTFDRYAIRLAEVRESIRIVWQILEKMPSGDYRVQDKKVTPPPRARIDESMEALIHHFKIFTEGFKVPEGEVYVAIESPRGELGCYMVSDGSAKPYRLPHPRPELREHPDPAAHDARRPRGRCRRRHLLGRPDPGRGRPMSRRRGWPLMARLTDANVVDRQGDHRPLPAAEVGAHPAAAPGPGAGRLRHRGRHGAPRRAARHSRRPRSTASPPSTRCSSSSPSASTSSTCAPTSPASWSVAGSCSSTPRSASAIKAGRHDGRRPVHPRGRRVHRRLHRGALPPGELPLPLQGHQRRLRPAARRPPRRAARRRGARRTARWPVCARRSPADRWAGTGNAGPGRGRRPMTGPDERTDRSSCRAWCRPGPKIVTSRFDVADGYTIDGYERTGGYDAAAQGARPDEARRRPRRGEDGRAARSGRRRLPVPA